ncbi:MAG: hypothetical protein FJ202_09780 [Gemmatimonadetes bacterium]|nr:hypothetical protein [Gemmatimonadota bacterium]
MHTRHTPAPGAAGYVLVELALTLALMGILAAIAVPNFATMHDRWQVRAAQRDILIGIWATRSAAGLRGDLASFIVDAAAGRIRVMAGADTVFQRDLRASRGVSVSVTRDSITFLPTGVGYGAANTRIVVSRGKRADTVTTARLGRVTWSRGP